MLYNNLAINGAGHLVFAGYDTVELAQTYGTALMVMCATVPRCQGKGYGSSCIRALVNRICKTTSVYVMCLPGMCEYYEKMGFKIVSGFVY